MELVEGETLAEQLRRSGGPGAEAPGLHPNEARGLPLDEALPPSPEDQYAANELVVVLHPF